MGRNERKQLKSIDVTQDVPKEIKIAGTSAICAVIGIHITENTKFERYGGIIGGFGGAIVGYYLFKD